MATDSPPTFFFNGINFNPSYYENEVNNNITQSAGDARYLEKLGDTATGLIAFNSGLSSSGAITSTGTTYGTGIIANKIDCTGSLATVFLDVSGSGNNGIRTYNGHIYSTGSGNISTNTGNISTTTGSITGGALSCTTITSNNNTITAGSSSVTGGSIISSTFNSGGISSVLDIGANQTSGILSIGNNASRTGAINIGTLTTGAHTINIGNSASSQTVNINRPLTTNSISTNNNTFTSGTGSITGGALSCTTINTNNNTITAGSSSVTGGSIISSTFNSGDISSVLDIGANQTSGILSIGNNASRTGAINIGTLTTGAHTINIGNSASSQTVNINRPLTTNSISTNNNTFTSGTGSITGGALSCTTITTNNNTFTSGTGSITGGALSCTTINTNNNTITSGSGSITSTGLIKGGSFQNTAGSMTVASDGSMTGLKLTLNGVAGVSCYNLDIRNSYDNSYRGSINGLLGLFELKGVIDCVGFYVKNFISNTIIAYINDIGNLSCNTITSNNNTITAGTSSVSGGSILSSTFNSGAPGSVLDIGANQTTGILSIGNNAARTGAINIGTLTTGTHAINIGNSASNQTVNINRPLTTNSISTNNNTFTSGTGSITGGALSCTTITSNNNTITAGTSSVTGGSIISSTFNSGAPGSVLDIGANQTSGILSIGNNASRTGAINIGTLTTGAHAINIGNSASTQTVTINRPIRMPGLSYSNGNEIGYSQNNIITFSAFNPTPNPPLPGTLMNTPITTTNLINNANYLIKYSLIIAPQVSFNVTKLQYGLYTTGFVTSCSNNQSVNGLTSTGATTTTRFLSTDTYSYSGSGFFKYNSASSYSFSYFIDYLATAPIIVANIDLIRIS